MNAAASVRILPLGDAAATIVFGDSINPATHALVDGFCGRLAEADLPGLLEWAPAFASVTLWYDPDQIGFDALQAALAPMAGQEAPAKLRGGFFEIPFCADADLAPDLAATAALNGFSPERYIAEFAALIFDVYMLGFQPGFAYLGVLPDALNAPRLATPRKKVPARSLAIADSMCAAYPFDSPGGWRLIGRTPAPLFDARDSERPALLAAGDRVRWRPIDRAAFDRLERQWAAGEFAPNLLRAAP
jgi:KipI family sensor histidine kinase inhibitor